MVNVVNLLKLIFIMSAVYAFGMTIFVHALPSDTLTQVDPFSNFAQTISLTNLSQQVESNVEQQTNIPLIEVGALIFFSGNIFLDLVLNFVFAIPQMIILFISGFQLIGFNIDGTLLIALQLLISVLISVLYFVGVIELILNIRSGRQIAS